jgi:hypothetical protein
LHSGRPVTFIPSISGLKLSISGLTFINAFSNDSGGAIFANMSSGSVTLDDCHFKNTKSNAVQKHHQQGNHTFQAGGGAVYVENGELSVRHSTFQDCAAPFGAGGAILRVGTAQHNNVEFSDNTFISCRSGEAGGAVALVHIGRKSCSDGQIIINSTSFVDCAVFQSPVAIPQIFIGGGALVMYCKYKASNLTTAVKDVIFSGNRVTGATHQIPVGGAVLMYYTEAAEDTKHAFANATFALNKLVAAKSGTTAASGAGLAIQMGEYSAPPDEHYQLRNVHITVNECRYWLAAQK